MIWGTLLNSVYASVPMIYDEKFWLYDGSDPHTIFVWVIALHEEEGNYIRANGWGKFEDLLERADPELWDLQRPPVI